MLYPIWDSLSTCAAPFYAFPAERTKNPPRLSPRGKAAQKLPNIFILASPKGKVKNDPREMNKISLFYKIKLCNLYIILSCKKRSSVVKYSQKGWYRCRGNAEGSLKCTLRAAIPGRRQSFTQRAARFRAEKTCGWKAPGARREKPPEIRGKRG